MSSQNKKVANWQATLNRIAAAEARHKATSSAAAPPADTMPPMPPPPAAPVVEAPPAAPVAAAPPTAYPAATRLGCRNCNEPDYLQGRCYYKENHLECITGLYVEGETNNIFQFTITSLPIFSNYGMTDTKYILYLSNSVKDHLIDTPVGSAENMYYTLRNTPPGEANVFDPLPRSTFFRGLKNTDEDRKLALEKHLKTPHAAPPPSAAEEKAKCIEEYEAAFRGFNAKLKERINRVKWPKYQGSSETLESIARREGPLLKPSSSDVSKKCAEILGHNFFAERSAQIVIPTGLRSQYNSSQDNKFTGSFGMRGGRRRSSKTKRARRSKRKGTRRN